MWLCTIHPIETYQNPISGEQTEPFLRCTKVNGGDCADFEAGSNALNPAPMKEANDG